MTYSDPCAAKHTTDATRDMAQRLTIDDTVLVCDWFAETLCFDSLRKPTASLGDISGPELLQLLLNKNITDVQAKAVATELRKRFLADNESTVDETIENLESAE